MEMLSHLKWWCARGLPALKAMCRKGIDKTLPAGVTIKLTGSKVQGFENIVLWACGLYGRACLPMDNPQVAPVAMQMADLIAANLRRVWNAQQ